MRTFEAGPRAATLIESLRNMGYSLETALADLVDNSITAGARTVRIQADTSDFKMAVLDDGHGMTEPVLFNAMRLGTTSPLQERDRTDLGRFGLGLKTASFSQCRRLTVITRCDGQTNAARWDLDRVEETDEWLVEVPDDLESVPWFQELGVTGTLVVWEKLDRVQQQGSSDNATLHFTQLLNDSRNHLELVFHRFLAGEPAVRKVQMELNDRPLAPFDPFNPGHPATIRGPEEKIRVSGHTVTVQTFTLPHRQKVSEAEWNRYAGPGPNGYVRNQGFYVYRAKRLIMYGTWFGLAGKKELTQLARVRIDLPNALDEEWGINVMKSIATPPYPVRERLRRIIETIGATSKRVYTVRGRKILSDNRVAVWDRFKERTELRYRINPKHPVLQDLDRRLSPDLARDFHHVLEIIASSLPLDALFADLGEDTKRLTNGQISDDSLALLVRLTRTQLIETGLHAQEIAGILEGIEPYRSNWERTLELLNQPDRDESGDAHAN